MVQRVHTFGRRSGEHVRQMLAQELADIPARGVIVVNLNHRLKFTGAPNQYERKAVRASSS
jgi:hypothetical protein